MDQYYRYFKKSNSYSYISNDAFPAHPQRSIKTINFLPSNKIITSSLNGYLRIHENKQEFIEKKFKNYIKSIDIREKGGIIAVGFSNGFHLLNEENIDETIAKHENHRIIGSIYFNEEGDSILLFEEYKKNLWEVKLDKEILEEYDDDKYKKVLFKYKKYYCFEQCKILLGLIPILFLTFGIINYSSHFLSENVSLIFTIIGALLTGAEIFYYTCLLINK